MSQFYEYFKENMAGLGLPAPEGLFGSMQSAVTTANSILGLVDKFGPRVTVLELGGARTKVELLGVLGTCSAAYYLGAVIGSLAVASGRSLGVDRHSPRHSPPRSATALTDHGWRHCYHSYHVFITQG